MSTITINIVKSPAGVNNTAEKMEFIDQGGTIGRSADNTWALDDPQRFISGVHVEVTYEQTHYYLIDRSTNGTFHNGSVEPIGKGNRVLLNDGDHFSLGDYDFLVSIDSGLGAPSATPITPDIAVADVSAGPFADLGITPSQNVDPLAVPLSSASSTPFVPPSPSLSNHAGFDSIVGGGESTDPLALLGGANVNSPIAPIDDTPQFSSSYADRAEPLAQSFSLPEVSPNAIPEDWDLDHEPVSTAIPPEPVVTPTAIPQAVDNDQVLRLQQTIEALQAENRSLQAQLQQAKANSAVQPVPAAGGVSDDELLNALGLGKLALDGSKRAELGALAGEFIRETISGMMQVLSSRNSIKNEFRMNVTTIQPVENNPLKFSANLEDAIENMFIKEGNAYKKPVEALCEGFQGISDHQLALLAGIRAAFTGGIERFDPEALEQRFSKYQKSSLLQMGKKGKNWDFYKEYYSELVSDMDGSFRHLFGDEFVHAYEDQLHRLALSRKAENK